MVGSELNQSTRKVCRILNLAIMQDFIEYYEAKIAANIKINPLSQAGDIQNEALFFKYTVLYLCVCAEFSVS